MMQTPTDARAGSGSITIAPVIDADELRRLEDLQAQVWADDPRMVVPSHILYLVGTTGGILLGAFDGAESVGLVLGLLATEDGRLYHASHMMGIHPDYQSHGIGYLLKQAQRSHALQQGLDLMTWTFDPLESRNAYFNLHKLGVFSRTYKENVYGSMRDVLNRGLPSDRLLVEWNLPEPDHGRIPEPVIPLLSGAGGRPQLELHPTVLGQPLSVSIPTSIQQLKRDDPDLALAWRMATRQALTWAFSHGYVAREFRDSAYILTYG